MLSTLDTSLLREIIGAILLFEQNRTSLKEKLDASKKTILAALEKNKGIISVACNAVGLARSTYYEWLKSDQEFKEAVDDIQEYTIDLVENQLLKRIDAEDTTAIIFYLKTKGKKRGFVERQELSGLDGRDLFVDKPDTELKGQLATIMQKLNGANPDNQSDQSSAGTTDTEGPKAL